MERYFREKELILNASKSKILFSKRDREKEKRSWKWKHEEIKEVVEFKYLGFTFKKNSREEAHIKDVTGRAAAVMAQIWGIGGRKFGEDFPKRIMMFNVMVRAYYYTE